MIISPLAGLMSGSVKKPFDKELEELEAAARPSGRKPPGARPSIPWKR